ncbi:MAG: response regulator [Comamonadaceae bacterium]|nr:MAG: response regulator [Comamonadaceae bacterium]
MTTLLIIEPDDAVRSELLQMLAFQGFDTLSAADGLSGLAQCRAFTPHLVVCAAGLPDMADGGRWGVLEVIRADKRLQHTPVIVLAAPDDPDGMAGAMAAGANDCVIAPYSTGLLDSIDRQLRKRARPVAPLPFGGDCADDADRSDIADTDAPVTLPLPDSTVLFSQIRNLATFAGQLATDEMADLLDSYFAEARQRLRENGALHIYTVGQGLVAVFRDTSPSQPPSAARRAVSAALSMAIGAHGFRRWLRERFPGQGLPPLAVCTGIDIGDAALCQIGTVPGSEAILLGDAVNKATRLESAGREMGWSVVVSEAVLAASGDGVQSGVRSRLLLPVVGGNEPVEAIQITGLDATPQLDGSPALEEALRFNSELKARIAKGALDVTLAALADPAFEPATAADGVSLQLKGYRVIRKLASGGMSEVYLAERDAEAANIVLKVLDLKVRRHAGELTRFIREYALLSAIAHPNVIRIHDQGFTDAFAYIAMEYFSAGDLRTLMRGPTLSPGRVVQIVRDVAAALAEIHAAGIVHCDVKPENIMLRDDGSAALADFGIARRLHGAAGAPPSPADADDEHELIGTPYYLSPEQAGGEAVTTQSDLYSLGVMLFEMLARRRPFTADSLELLREKHRDEATPALPAAHRRFQPVVDKLMQKQPSARHGSAAGLIAELAALGE